MKTLLRCGYLALIVLGLVIQLTRGQESRVATDPMASLAIGLARLNIRTGGLASENILTGSAPSCARPIHVMLLRIDGTDDDLLRGLRPDDYLLKYVYLGSVLESKNELNMIGRWVWASAMFVVGLRLTRPEPALVVIVLPRACPDLAKIEWATLSTRS